MPTPTSPLLNQSGLEPIFLPWEAPDKHRRPNPQSGGAAIIEMGRRASKAMLVPRIREAVDDWRRGDYAGASDTTRMLLDHWFRTEHADGFRYHFCQREAIEAFIWLYEVAQYRDLSSIYSSLWGDEADPVWEKQITAVDDAWARGAAKIATGGGKTKVMSLVMVWSYFHKRLEPNSDMATHFVAIAPNLIVFERLKDDFLAKDGQPSIFHRDPLLPPEWKGEWDVPVILQDDPGGATGAGALYLTNIHRLYERKKTAAENGNTQAVANSIIGPTVKRAKALSTGEQLRARIASHPSILVLNDEAHHLHDPESAWNEAINSLDADSKARGNGGITAQFDFTATPKYPDGGLFKHIVCDFPLGEAVDAGIVKAPVLGRSDALKPNKLDNAAQKYRAHLLLGYKQYEWSLDEWKDSGRKPIMFVMTESTQAADEVTEALNTNKDFKLLNGKVINLHTKLKGKIKKGKGGAPDEFEVNERQMSDDDLKAVRELASSLDSPNSPYNCVVSVLMLREGWDVKNVTTIVPLRAFSGTANILAEQTLGRGLRRMTPISEGAIERVTVVEQSAFVKLYEQELALEGVIVQVTDADQKAKAPSVSIFVDPHKNASELDISYPRVSDGVQTIPTVENLSFEEVRDFFLSKYQRLPIGSASAKPINFELRALFTDELIASWNIDRGLLQMGFTAVSVFVKELEKACGLTGNHVKLAPLVQKFIEEVLFERPVNLYGGEVDHRMSNGDVAEHIRATFAPLIRDRTILETKRERSEDTLRISDWKPFQAANLPPKKLCVPATKTLFNLVPCDLDLERQFAQFCDDAEDVKAFAKNAGPQKIGIDYKAATGRSALYWPDFLVRDNEGKHYLVETKGQQDTNVPHKASAAVAWCKAASKRGQKWAYLFVPQAVFEEYADERIAELASACVPSLKHVLEKLETSQLDLPLDATPEEVKEERTDKALEDAGISELPEDLRIYVTQAVNQLAYDRKKNYPQFGAAFQPLLYPLEALCGDVLQHTLASLVPTHSSEAAYYFEPDLSDLSPSQESVYARNGRYLRKNLVYGQNNNRVGILLFCLEYAGKTRPELGGIWMDVRRLMQNEKLQSFYPVLDSMYKFRNRYVAHGDEQLQDGDAADAAMKEWIGGLTQLSKLAEMKQVK
jgi:type III restriction enzyme